MIRTFANRGTQDVFDGKNTKQGRKVCPKELGKVAAWKLDQLDSAVVLEDLRVPPGNRLEALTGNRKGRHSIRINDPFRICFEWTDTGPKNVEITDYH